MEEVASAGDVDVPQKSSDPFDIIDTIMRLEKGKDVLVSEKCDMIPACSHMHGKTGKKGVGLFSPPTFFPPKTGEASGVDYDFNKRLCLSALENLDKVNAANGSKSSTNGPGPVREGLEEADNSDGLNVNVVYGEIVSSKDETVPESEIKDICANSMDPGFCSDFMKSDRRLASADLEGVAQISIDTGHSKATDNLNFVKSLAQKTTDHKLQDIYKSCATNYEDAVASYFKF
ncbi:hypothetical protein Tsubulata_031251 [Turnera subulata]|uniref:Pectinesterase inhibitor domain-containing protein n=1 Tax=Turnera subulata TaxID=218843 RepID=A0A9Q0FHX1_9ROSI|nr:hypothetical protein Tsubulata_031251 [Turnera subulata]